MPLFEFDCQQCQSRFELLVRESKPLTCPECHSSDLQKLLSLPAAHTGHVNQQANELPFASAPCGRGGCGLPECGG